MCFENEIGIEELEDSVFPRAKKGGASGRFTFPADELHAADTL